MAAAVGLSRFHLSRTFAQTTGRSFTAHLRGRRLTEAARVLAGGVEAIRMPTMPTPNIDAPEIRQVGPLLIAGITGAGGCEVWIPVGNPRADRR